MSLHASDKIAQGGITKEEALKMAEDYCFATNRDSYWKIDKPSIKLRSKGKYKGEIWDISYPPIEDGWGKSKLDPHNLEIMQMMPFTMIVFINTGEMKYNKIVKNDNQINVTLMPARVSK